MSITKLFTIHHIICPLIFLLLSTISSMSASNNLIQPNDRRDRFYRSRTKCNIKIHCNNHSNHVPSLEDKYNTSLVTQPKLNAPIPALAADQTNSNRDTFSPDFDGNGVDASVNSGAKSPKGFYVTTKGYRLEPELDIPAYVRSANHTYPELKNIDWLDIGLDSRIRYEYHENDLRPWIYTNNTNDSIAYRRYYPQSIWLERSRAYIGVKNILDPLRLVLELQDARAFNNIYTQQPMEASRANIVQSYGELFFDNALGVDPKGQPRPIAIRAGRMAFDIGDRRLISRNNFLNTAVNFDGVRLKLGKKENDVDLDSFAMRPVNQDGDFFSRDDTNNTIYGSWLSLRMLSQYATLQPYFLGRKQSPATSSFLSTNQFSRNTSAPGLRVYGIINNFDYDINFMKQFGSVTRNYQTFSGNSLPLSVPHNATAYTADIGYTIENLDWKPRISFVYIYGSGNKSSFSLSDQDVDIFYPFNQSFTRSRLVNWDNIKDPKIRLEFNPAPETTIDTAFSAYWLASAAAAETRMGLYAPLGNRGTFLGTEFDFRIQQRINEFLNISLSYDRFWPGSFASSFAPPVGQQWPPVSWPGGSWPGQTGTTNGITSKPMDFIYIEASVNGFGDGAQIDNKRVLLIPNGENDPNFYDTSKNWNNIYLGVTAGSNISAINSADTGTTVLNNDALVQQQSISLSGMLPASLKHTNLLSGFVGGLQIGWNKILYNQITIGINLDFDGTTGSNNRTWSLTPASLGNTSYTSYYQNYSSLNYLATAMFRLGLTPNPRWNFYLSAGGVLGGITQTNNYVTVNNVKPTAPLFYGPQLNSSLSGWGAGGGMQYIISPTWNVDLNYTHFSLGSFSSSDPTISPQPNIYLPTPFKPTFLNYSQSHGEIYGSIFKIGLNKTFNIPSFHAFK